MHTHHVGGDGSSGALSMDLKLSNPLRVAFWNFLHRNSDKENSTGRSIVIDGQSQDTCSM